MPSGSAMAVEEEEALIQNECERWVPIRGSLGEHERREKDELGKKRTAFDRDGLFLKVEEEEEDNKILFSLREKEQDAIDSDTDRWLLRGNGF